MRKLIAVVLAIVALQAYLAHGIQMAAPTSSKMVKICSIQEGEVADASCQAFVQGVADVTAFYGIAKQLTPSFCIPDDTAPAELVAVYRDYLKDNHVLRQFSAAALAVSAFKDAFPCE
jgi:hypothetical protein